MQMNGRELAVMAAEDYERLLHVALKYTRPDVEAARDAVQDTLLNILAARIEVAPEKAWGYLFVSVRNTVTNWYRQRSARREGRLGNWDTAAPIDVERTVCRRETISEVLAMGTPSEVRDLRLYLNGEYDGSSRERVNRTRLRARARAAGLSPA